MAAEDDQLAAAQSFIRQLGKSASGAFKLKDGSGVTSKETQGSETILTALQALEKKDVLVGVPAEDAGREDGELNNAARLYIHEFGAPEANIPARPTVMPGIQNSRELVQKYMGAAARAAAKGDAKAIEVNMNRAGIAAADAIKTMINSNVPPPLSERTLRERTEKHLASLRGKRRRNIVWKGAAAIAEQYLEIYRTLVDTGEMRNAVTYILRDK